MIIANTPMIIPKVVRKLLNLFATSERYDSLNNSFSSIYEIDPSTILIIFFA